MKRIKIVSLILALIMIFSLGITAFASSGSNDLPTKKVVELDPSAQGESYRFYRILDATIMSGTPDSEGRLPVSYTLNENFEYYFTEGPGKTYFSKTPVGEDAVPVIYEKTVYYLNVTEQNVEAFANQLRAYVDLSIEHGKTFTLPLDNGERSFETKIGCYYVRSDVGNKITLLTNNQNDGKYIVRDKNKIPTVVKKGAVLTDNLTDADYADVVHVEAGEIVRFKIEVKNVEAGAENYVIYDKYSSAEFAYTGACEESLYYIGNDNQKHRMDPKSGSDDESYDYSFSKVEGVGHCWYIARDFDYTNVKGFVAYIDLRHKAPAPRTGYTNIAYATYGTSNHKTNEEDAKVYGSGIRIIKYANGNTEDRLAGVKFILMKKIDGVSYYAKYETLDGLGDKITWTTDQGQATEYVTSNSEGVTDGIRDYGKIEFWGLRYGETYSVIETEAAPGFNPLDGPKEIKLYLEPTDNLSSYYYDPGEGMLGMLKPKTVENLSGTLIPETGGIGTTLFYVLGSVMAVGAFVLLITNKRVRK